MHFAGRGFPDLVVGFRGQTYLYEVKNPEWEGELNQDQIEWFADWKGHAAVIECAEDALRDMGVIE